MDSVTTALEHLTKAGLIERTADGQVGITAFGKMILNKRLNSLDIDFLKRFTDQ